jgi:hypothetical protein
VSQGNCLGSGSGSFFKYFQIRSSANFDRRVSLKGLSHEIFWGVLGPEWIDLEPKKQPATGF